MLYMRCLPRSRGVPNLFSLLLVGKYGLTWANLSSYPPSSVDLPGSNRHLWILWHVKLASIIPSRPQSLCFNEELAGFQPPAAAWVGGLLLILSKIWAPVHLKCPRKLFRLDNHHSNLGKRAWKWCVCQDVLNQTSNCPQLDGCGITFCSLLCICMCHHTLRFVQYWSKSQWIAAITHPIKEK